LAEDRASKTEKPTGRRRSEARKKGQIAKSQDLNVAILMIGIFAGLALAGSSGVTSMRLVMRELLQSLGSFRFDMGGLIERLSNVGWVIFCIVGPIVGCAFLCAILANLIQVGFLFTTETFKPNLNKLNPLSGLGRIVSIKGIMKVTFAIIKISIIGSVLVWTLWEQLADVEGESVHALLYCELERSLQFGLNVVLVMLARGCVALLILAIFDYAYQRWQHERDLMMSKEEIRQEMLQMEGDPKVKERRRKVQMQLMAQTMMREVPNADVVISNPTHFALAIKYDRDTMTAPRCVAKGQDYLARRMREIAMENDVPVVVRPPLARALFAVVQPGQEIPEDFYHAVAEILAYVYRLANRQTASAAS
jgi:flagellar biosynthetic protein FlhB